MSPQTRSKTSSNQTSKELFRFWQHMQRSGYKNDKVKLFQLNDADHHNYRGICGLVKNVSEYTFVLPRKFVILPSQIDCDDFKTLLDTELLIVWLMRERIKARTSNWNTYINLLPTNCDLYVLHKNCQQINFIEQPLIPRSFAYFIEVSIFIVY